MKDTKETVRTLCYKEDFPDPLSIIIASKELTASTEGIIGIVNNITVVHKDTRDVNKEDYYILMTVVNGSCDTVSSEECEPGQESQREQEPEEPSSRETNCRPKRNRNADSMFFY